VDGQPARRRRRDATRGGRAGRGGRGAGRPLPLARGLRIYAENLAREVVARHGIPGDRPEDADLAIVRLMAPFEPRSDLFLESWFHQGSLDYPPGLQARAIVAGQDNT